MFFTSSSLSILRLRTTFSNFAGYRLLAVTSTDTSFVGGLSVLSDFEQDIKSNNVDNIRCETNDFLHQISKL